MLTNRQLLILQEIITNFISNAQPVGSRSLSKSDAIQLSSATIRNEMSDLEELGYLEKTHSSSGRIPSQKGYRYYVDNLLSAEKLRQEEIVKISSIFQDRLYEYEKVVQSAAEILSELTNYTAVLLGPSVTKNRLKKLQIIPLNEGTATAIIVTDTGHVEHRTFSIPATLEPSDLEKMVNILNERLVGVPLSQLSKKIKFEVTDLLHRHINNYDLSFKSVIDSLALPVNEKLFFGGKANMLTQPEFHDIDKIQLLFKLIEEKEGMYELIKGNPVGINVKIGKENKVIEMQECSLVTATYAFDDANLGTIAIIGPTRMEYSRVISILKHFTKDLENIYSNISYKK